MPKHCSNIKQSLTLYKWILKLKEGTIPNIWIKKVLRRKPTIFLQPPKKESLYSLY